MSELDYTDVLEAATPDRDADTDGFGVYYVVGSSRGRTGHERSTYTYYVVDHDAERVLLETRTAFQHRENPSPVAVAERARGFRRGYATARADE